MAGYSDRGIPEVTILKYLLNLHDYPTLHTGLVDPEYTVLQPATRQASETPKHRSLNFETTHPDTEWGNVEFCV